MLVRFPDEFKIKTIKQKVSSPADPTSSFLIKKWQAVYNRSDSTVNALETINFDTLGQWSSELNALGNTLVMGTSTAVTLEPSNEGSMEPGDSLTFYDYELTVNGVSNPESLRERSSEGEADYDVKFSSDKFD